MKPLTKECIELIQKELEGLAFVDSGEYTITTAVIYGFKKALTTPEIYRAVGLTEVTQLTDEELEKEAEELYSMPNSEVDLYIGLVAVQRAAHIKARKMGSSGWVSVEDRLPEKFDKTILVCDEDDYVNIISWDELRENHTHWQPLPSPPKTKPNE
jgi:hypothetical protein